MIERATYLRQLQMWRDKKVIKVITGIRRCGKSTLLKMFAGKLKEEGIESRQIMEINFEDIDNEPLLDYKVLYRHVKDNLVAGKTNYLFFDEIQSVNEFQRVIDSLNLLENVDIYVTGSNAYLLSGEIATLLSGRYVEIKVYPLSFREFIAAFPEGADKATLYRRYTEFGSFPYIPSLNGDRSLIADYLQGIYNTIVVKDIMTRRKISDMLMLQSVIRFLADNIGNITAIKRISDTLTSAGRKISSHTVENYISALTDSYIFYPATRYDVKGMQYLKTGQKYYLADMGLRRLIIGTKSGDLGHILENVVYLELLRRGYEVYVGKTEKAEIDFVAIRNEEKEYFQVALSVRDEKTLDRELEPLKGLNDFYPKHLLTLDNDLLVMHNGIRQEYVIDWLLAE